MFKSLLIASDCDRENWCEYDQSTDEHSYESVHIN